MKIENSSLKDAFYEKKYWEESDNGGQRLKAKNNYVGIVNLKGNDKSQEEYCDKKIFPEDISKRTPLLFLLYKFASNDSEERYEILKSFKYNAESKISLGAGLFDTLLPPIFLNELIKILNFGFHKEYVSKEENLVFVRGKINIKSQIKNEIKRKPQIACEFWEITTNNFLNQAILKATTHLINKPDIGKGIKSKLALCASKIRQEFVDDVYIGVNDFIKQRRIPKRYKTIINLAEAVIKRQHHSIKYEKVKCPSFMINMATVWESFLRAVIRKEFEGKGWKVDKIREKLNIFKGLSVTGIPDIILYNKENYIILDAKYKPSKSNPDLYQIGAYLGSAYGKYTKTLKGILLYFGREDSNGSDQYGQYIINTTEKESVEIPLNILYLSNLIDEHCEGGGFNVEDFSEELSRIIQRDVENS